MGRAVELPEGVDPETRALLTRFFDRPPSDDPADYHYTGDARIDRDLDARLRRDLDAFLAAELFAAEPVTPEHFDRVRTARRFGIDAIARLASIEDARRDAWLAVPAVAAMTHGITLDRIPENLYPEIANNAAQRAAWADLFALDVAALADADLLRAHPHLVLDTRHFDTAFAEQLLPHLAEPDGLLIHGENYRALTYLRATYRRRVDVIYIDPPYNTSDEDFVYRNSYSRSDWVALMRDRCALGRELLADSGVFAVAVDDTMTAPLRLLLDDLFGPENYLTTLVAEVNPAGQNLRPNVPARSHDYCHVYARDATKARLRPRPLTADEAARYTESDAEGRFLWDNLRRRGGNSRPDDRPNQWYPLYVDLARGIVRVEPFAEAEEVWPIDPRGERRIWRVAPATARREIARGDIGVVRRAGRAEVVKKSRLPAGKKPKTLWKDPRHSATSHGTKLLEEIVATNVFTYPKSMHLVADILDCWAAEDAVVLDFFAGSGTTAHAVLALNRRDGGRRRYVLVEAGDHFETVLRPRVMKVIYAPQWRRRQPRRRDLGASHTFQCVRLVERSPSG